MPNNVTPTGGIEERKQHGMCERGGGGKEMWRLDGGRGKQAHASIGCQAGNTFLDTYYLHMQR